MRTAAKTQVSVVPHCVNSSLGLQDMRQVCGNSARLWTSRDFATTQTPMTEDKGSGGELVNSGGELVNRVEFAEDVPQR